MNLSKAAISILSQLAHFLTVIRDPDFATPSKLLSGSTLGQHIRHTLEFFICFQQGCLSGIVNYDKRRHDKQIETDKTLASFIVGQTIDFVRTIPDEIPLKLEVSYTEENTTLVDTNSTRELVYNIEHTVHHMALIKIGVHEVAPYVTLPADFGIAVSTMRSRQATTSGVFH
jgi:hypothetical protein